MSKTVPVASDQALLTLSVAIVTYAPAADELARALECLAVAVGRGKDAPCLGPVSLTLIDNGPGNNRPVLQSLIDAPRVLATLDERGIISGHGNIGFGRGHNLALAETQADLHLVLNPDVWLNPDALVKACLFLQANPEVVLVAPSASWPDGEQQFLCKRYPAVLDLFLRGFAPDVVRKLFSTRLDRYEMRDVCGTEPVFGIPISSGCFMLARRDALMQIGGFSDRFFLYFEDFDLSIRLREIGLIAYVPSIRIVHAGGRAALKGWGHIRMFAASAMKFFSRHGWKIW